MYPAKGKGPNLEGIQAFYENETRCGKVDIDAQMDRLTEVYNCIEKKNK